LILIGISGCVKSRQNAIPHAYLWILPNSSHSTLIDYADEFNKKVDAFFSGSTSK